MPLPPRRTRTTGAFAPAPLRASAAMLTIVVFVSSLGNAAEPDAVARAIERGWWTAARQASRVVGGDVAAIDRLEAEAWAANAARSAWLRAPASWTIRWSRPLSVTSLPDEPAGVPQPVLAAGIAAWSTSDAVHAVALDNGAAAWRSESTPDTTLFPRFIAPRSGPPPDTAVTGIAAAGHLVFAVVDAGDEAHAMVCLDCSSAAEGRLVWSAMPPSGMAAFDGPPVADGELCTIVARSADSRAALELVAFDARDGCLMWRQPVGTGVARDGVDHARGLRQPALCEDLVVVADHAGAVKAFTRGGRGAWVHRYDENTRDSGAREAARVMRLQPHAIAAGRDTIAVAPFDRGGVVALDVGGPRNRPPTVRWATPAGTAARIVGMTADRVVIETNADPQLQSLSILDGRVLAAGAGGGSLLAGDVVLYASGTGAGRLELVVRDAATLRPVAKPFALGSRYHETAVALACGPDALVVAAPGMLSCIVPSGSDTP